MSETEQLLISPDVVEQPAPELPGRRLREAREALGLTCHDVAQALKFSARQVEALERDDYSSLQGATFVRGFIRSYCRFLKLDPEPLLGLLTRDAPQETPEIVAPSNMGEATPRPFAERNRKWLVAAALLMLATVGLYVFVSSEFAASNEFRLSQQSHSADQAVAPPAVTPVTPTEAPSVAAPQPVPAPVVSEAPAAPAPGTAAPAPVVAAAAPAPAPAP
ncbi:MAG TPA: helix-turn-helix domain-containing protein, partial [Novosphingobium sp.]